MRYLHSRRGMSLLETMISIAIILVMTIVIYSVMDGLIRARQLLSESDETSRSARATTDKLRRELELSFLTSHTEAINSYQTVFVGVDENPDKLYFASLGHQRLYRDSRECDQTEITLWVDDMRDRDPGMVLFHREAPRVDEKPAEDGVILPLAYHVRSFNLRYLDPLTNEWRDDWDTRNADTLNRLPRAIELSMVLLERHESNSGRDELLEVPILTTIQLQYADHVTPDSQQALPPDTTGDSPTSGTPGGGLGGNPAGGKNPTTGPRSRPWEQQWK